MGRFAADGPEREKCSALKTTFWKLQQGLFQIGLMPRHYFGVAMVTRCGGSMTKSITVGLRVIKERSFRKGRL